MGEQPKEKARYLLYMHGVFYPASKERPIVVADPVRITPKAGDIVTAYHNLEWANLAETLHDYGLYSRRYHFGPPVSKQFSGVSLIVEQIDPVEEAE